MQQPSFQGVAVLEPRVNINSEKKYIVLKGGKRVTQQNYPSTSFSAAQAIFNFQTPSTNTIVDKKFYIKRYLRVTGTFTGGTPASIWNGRLGIYDGLRQYPIASCLEVLNVNINGSTVTYNVSDSIHYVQRYRNTKDEREHDYSETASMPDQYQNYHDAFLANPNIGGQSRNPLAAYGLVGQEQSRGAIMPVANDNSANDVLFYVVTEPVFLSPFDFGKGDHDGFVNVSQFLLTFTWGPLPNRAWSSDTSQTVPAGPLTIVVEDFQAPEILVTYISPEDISIIPKQISYPYNSLIQYIKTGPTLAAGASQNNYALDSIKLDQIPKRMYIFCRRSRGTSFYYTSDVCANITNVNINFMNEAGLLSTSTEQDLYNIAVRNGYDDSWMQWKRFKGSVLALEFGVDIALPPMLSPGMLQVQLSFNNPAEPGSAPVTYEIYIVTSLEGIFSISENQALAQLGILTPSEVLESGSQKGLDYKTTEMMSGGNMYSRLRHFVNSVAPYASAAHPALGVAAKILAQGAKAYDASHKEGKSKAKAKAPAKKGRKRKGKGLYDEEGGELYGGVVSRNALRKRM